MTERLTWEVNWEDDDIWEAYNDESILVGELHKERLGQYFQWLWYQSRDCFMSAGCLDEVRVKQKELNNDLRKTK